MVSPAQRATSGFAKRPRSRKSIGYLPSPNDIAMAFEKENLGGGDATTALDLRPLDTKANLLSKRSRSRSLGPGGLDALREDAGNRRKAAAIAAPKSILKPSTPLSPLKDIPVHKPSTLPRNTKSPSRSPRKGATTPQKNSNSLQISADTENATSPAKSGKKSPTKAQSQAVQGENSEGRNESDMAEEEARKAKTEASKQRDLRRKSMANRRVSFAPEATLHTWDMIEEMQDSTTSSASTNTTRRASAVSEASLNISPNTRHSPHKPIPTPDDPPSTPPSQVEDEVIKESPASQRNLHQKKRRRRSSAIPPMNFNNPEDDCSSPHSNSSGSEIDESPAYNEAMTGGGAVARVSQSPLSHRAEVDYDDVSVSADELGETPMDLADDEITAAFKPWSQTLFNGDHPLLKLNSSQDQENTNPFSPAFKNATGDFSAFNLPSSFPDDGGEMSMDITRAIGSIGTQLRGRTSSVTRPRQSPTPRRSVRSRRRSSVESTAMDDASMELTTAIGTIQSNGVDPLDMSNLDTNEELSMEFTSVFGGIRHQKDAPSPFEVQGSDPTESIASRTGGVISTRNLPSIAEDSTNAAGDMDLTMAFGTIMQTPVKERNDREEEDGIDMDITHAVGNILSSHVQPDQKTTPVGSAPIPDLISTKPLMCEQPAIGPRPLLPASVTRTPEKKARGRPVGSGAKSRVAIPAQDPQTPPKQPTPRTLRPLTPGKTPPFKDVTANIPSPMKLFQEEIGQAGENFVSAISSRLQLPENQLAPEVIPSPKNNARRRMSGVGMDKEGLGSPRVAMLLDRRRSIGEHSAPFLPSASGPRAVHFGNPKTLNEEISRAREHDQRRESGQYILEHEVDGEPEEKDATTTLKEAIISMTPKRKRLGGRKSLAVGAAKGLLGIRPAELDDSDEDRTPRGLRSNHASPVKRIKLSGPSPAKKNTGSGIKGRQSLACIPANVATHTPSTTSPSRTQPITTPKSQGRFKDVEKLPDAQLPLPTLGQHTNEPTAGTDEGHEKVHLRDFLNLTSIRFIELNTTKRRHTIAPQTDQDVLVGRLNTEGEKADSGKAFENSVVAGACTVALLELFQHACKELKAYIAGGRDLIREIEAETYSDNPALFREYMSAAPAARAIMDQQFKNMKTNARLLSKGMWYEWRMKLLEGLKEGLNGTAVEFSMDVDVLAKQEQVIQAVLPRALEEHIALTDECAILQARADEMATIDQEELAEAQKELLALENEVRAKTQLTEDYERGFRDLDLAIEHAHEKRVNYVQSIREAQKLREEHRGWSAMDVSKLNANVMDMEAKYGWSVTSASSGTLTLAYRRQLQIFFNVASFLPAAAATTTKHENSPISLIYVGDADVQKPKPLTTEKRFFLQLMRAHLQCLVQHQTEVKDLLRFVHEGWDKALEVSEEVSRLDAEFITNCSILSDERLGVKTTMLLPVLKTKVHVVFEIGAVGKGGEVEMGLTVKAEVVYGEKYKEDRMGDFLMSKVGRGGQDARVRWVDAVRDLKKRLIQQGKKG